ncbi:hypothetical protein EDB87DRAFT_1689522 [Lactarius vividus]|nr:hypothetical protein EDB87DRAFT_1689522 [Lactarius vividus]
MSECFNDGEEFQVIYVVVLFCLIQGVPLRLRIPMHLPVTFGPPVRATTPPRDQEDSSPVKFVAWSPARDPLDADAQAAEEAEARERLWKFHQSRALHLRAAILATQYTFPQDPPQGPED